jgi:hypothetical protein
VPTADPLAFIAKGYSVFPCGGKEPLTEHGFKDATLDPAQVERWRRRLGKKITGWASPDALVIDADGPAGIASYGRMVEEHGDVGAGPIIRTPGGGLHDWRSNPEEIPNRKLAPGLETRGAGGYAMLPGSVHPNGGVYEGELPPLDELPPPPAWVALRSSGPISVDVVEGKLPAGEPRHPHLVSLVGNLCGQGFGMEAVWPAVVAFNKAAFEEPMPEADLRGRVTRMVDAWLTDPLLARIGAQPVVDGDRDDLFYDPTERRRESYDPPAIAGLFYLGQRHVVFGEPECGKTWLLLAAVAEELIAGRAALWVDTDDMGDSPLVDRLLALGVPEEAVSAHLLYAQPEGRLTDAHVEEMASLARDRGVRLVVFDSFNATMLLEGLDPNSTTEVEAFFRRLASPVCREGAAFVAADHVVKAHENRHGSPYGSERKRSGVTAMIEMQIVEPFGRGRTGRSRLVVQKDRPGHLAPRGHAVGAFELGEHDGSARWGIVDLHELADDGHFRPTRLMQQVSEYLEQQPDAVTKNTVATGVGGKKKYVLEAIERLVKEGYVESTPGARRSQWLSSARPYREGLSDDLTTGSRVVPTGSQASGSLVPPLIGEPVTGGSRGGEPVDKSGGWD